MPHIYNVLEDQRFLLRCPDGTRTKKSFREILTEDGAYALDYPQEFYNAAALSLMAFLAQWIFEPVTVAELARRVEQPLSNAEFEQMVAQERSRFAVTGDSPRFMQGRPVEDVKKAESISVAVLIAPKGDRQFLFRSDAGWAVSPEQAGLFLFTRNTFYEGTGGRGYQKGTNGDTPIRTLITVPAEGDTIHLRQSIWLNVLAREKQFGGDYQGDFARRGSQGYDGLFWEKLPDRDVPVGGISLRAALGWMTAFHWLHFEESEAKWTCPVTGETVTGLVAARTTKTSTGIAYGAKGDLDSGVRADRLFRHPNVPTHYTTKNKTNGEFENLQAYSVDRSKGIINALGAAFFGAKGKSSNPERFRAPAVAQLAAADILNLDLSVRLLVFGFHMLSGQKNVHGGYELDAFDYRVLGSDDAETLNLMDMAQEIVSDASIYADKVARALQRAVQQTTGAGVRAKQNDEGNVVLEKTEMVKASDYVFGRDTVAEFWRAVQRQMHLLIGEISVTASGGPTHLNDQKYTIQQFWQETLTREVWRLYLPIFNQYSTLPRTMPYAFAARRFFNKALKDAATVQEQEVSA